MVKIISPFYFNTNTLKRSQVKSRWTKNLSNFASYEMIEYMDTWAHVLYTHLYNVVFSHVIILEGSLSYFFTVGMWHWNPFVTVLKPCLCQTIVMDTLIDASTTKTIKPLSQTFGISLMNSILSFTSIRAVEK